MDLKIVLYIIVAIIWVVYNNYKKIADASKKRDYSKPPPEVIQENWPKSIPNTRKASIPRINQPVEKPVVRKTSGTLYKETITAREPLKRHSLVSASKIHKRNSTFREGGSTQPSKIVHFEDEEIKWLEPNLLVEEIRNTDMRKAIILSEILKRPYN